MERTTHLAKHWGNTVRCINTWRCNPLSQRHTHTHTHTPFLLPPNSHEQGDPLHYYSSCGTHPPLRNTNNFAILCAVVTGTCIVWSIKKSVSCIQTCTVLHSHGLCLSETQTTWPFCVLSSRGLASFDPSKRASAVWQASVVGVAPLPWLPAIQPSRPLGDTLWQLKTHITTNLVYFERLSNQSSRK